MTPAIQSPAASCITTGDIGFDDVKSGKFSPPSSDHAYRAEV